MEENSALKNHFDHLPGSLLITDKRAKTVYANQAVERRTGFSLAETVGKKPGELWGGKMERSFYDAMWETIGRRGQPFIGKVENRRKDGSPYEETLYIAPIPDFRGETQYFAHLRPELSDARAEEEFRAGFQKRAATFSRDRHPLAWLFQILTKKNAPEENLPHMQEDFPDVSSLFRALFVEPLEKLFSRRYEDADLIRAAQSEPQKFSALYEKYYALVKQYFLRRLNNDWETAEDLSQEVFARAFRHLPSFRVVNASYYTYLLQISHNLLVNHYRKARQNVPLFEEEMAGGVIIPPGSREQESLEALIGGLSPAEKEVMLLKYREGWKARDIGAKLGKSENAVKLILSRTRKKMRVRHSA